MDYKYKETVTRENIEEDVKSEFKRRIAIDSVLISSYIFIIAVIYLSCKSVISNHFNNPIALALIILLAALLLCFLCHLMYNIYKRFTVMYDYTITTDRLVEIVPEKLLEINRDYSTVPFKFAALGKCSVSYRRRYYKWSKNHNMYGYGLVNCSHLNDDFYLIASGKKILCFYNKKFFTLDESIAE